ncbi:HEXXH motif domain-containing protein [Streptacidiphilus pinicola]|uniref:HEXXH motif domain-containing protein n=2 Tax=Streptacidiphilus pinicola TaxID=2219663 RepID=A0A2X0K9P0_9ACTN|nr:HEXXH motif domain-containing protein [Streptacidiphilus pinicola]
MPGAWFDELAAGGGSAEAVGFLLEGERARRLLLLRRLLDRLRADGDLPGGAEAVDRSWKLLSAAARAQPAAAELILMSPQVGSWLGHALRRLHGSSSGPPLRVDLGHLAAVALAACVRAGLDADTEIPVRDGVVPLPTLGVARLNDSRSGGRGLGGTSSGDYGAAVARLRGPALHLDDGRSAVEVRPLDRAGGSAWDALHVLTADAPSPAWTWLDDVDPYRDLDEPIAPQRLDDAEVEQWRRRFVEAVDQLTAPPGRPGGLHVEQVRCIVPWNVDAAPGLPSAADYSASTGDAFGAMIVALPQDGASLAATMVHEFQHSKLGALLHLFPLLEDSGREEFYAPWRSDPRHVTGLLHGAYAFTGVAGFWREHHARTGSPEAAFRFAQRRLQARLVTRTLSTRAQLTPVGRRLVRGLTRTLDGWLREPLPAVIRARARAAVRRHRVEWRLRNLRSRPEERQALALAFHAGGAPVPGSAFAPVLAVEPARAFTTRPEPSALADWLLEAVAQRPTYRPVLYRPERLAALVEATGSPARPADLHRLTAWLATRA